MGAFDRPPNITIPDPNGGKASEAYRKKHGEDATAEQEFREKWGWEPHEQVIIKGAFTGVEQEAVDNASNAIKGRGRNRDIEVRVGTARNKLLEVMIIGWTFRMNGREVEVSERSILRLPANYRKPILEKCDEIAQLMDEEEQEDFLHSSNGHSQDTSETTSLSPMPS